MQNKCLQTLFTVAAVSASTAAFSEKAKKITIVPLAEARSELVAPSYTAAERQLVADQAYLFIKNMYVHRELKILDFGVSADPVPRLADVQRKAAKMSNKDFHETMQKIFLDLHDHHTNYGAPLPLGCSYTLAPLIFRDVLDGGKQKIVFDTVSRLFRDLEGEHKKAVPLDELVAVNGTPIEDYLEVLKAESGGANPDAMVTSGLRNLAIRSLAELKVPSEDTIVYKLKGADGTYTIESNLYAIVNEPSCVAQSQEKQARQRPVGVSLTDMEDPKTKVWRKLVAPEVNVPFADDLLSEIASVADLSTPAGKLTYVKLFTFMPEKASVESLIHRFREVLTSRQATSVGLIIDIRGNGGGAIKLAEEMVQIFTPTLIVPMPVRLLPNDLNLKMFINSNGGNQNGWSTDVKTAMGSGAKYTTPRVITTSREANRFGQAWFKPVVVLTDSSCYSACDLFAAGMQDHGAATIIGTHAATGAGGANVMEYGSFRAVFGGDEVDENPFKALPDSQSMRVSWRQTLRTGKNAGKLIEDAGIKPDILIRQTKEDLGVGESRQIMANVRKILEKLGPNFQSSIKLKSSVRMENNTTAKWSEETKGIDHLDVLLDGKQIDSYEVDSKGEQVDIELSKITGQWENRRFELVGKLKGSVKFRIVRELFWRGDDIKLTRAGIQEDVGNAKYLHSFVAQGSSDDSWQSKSGVLRVGAGPLYRSSIVSEAFIPLDVSDVSGDVMLNIDFSLESEDGMDVFSIIARDTTSGSETYLHSLDGIVRTNGTYPLAIPNNGKNIELVLEFESDENWNLKGPEIKKLGIKSRSIFDFVFHRLIGNWVKF
ncbi:MAG: S41 family peptidase [Proteobacteria bacterium]|nr:S41 family peptidase [Pseudomonadota bacterium]